MSFPELTRVGHALLLAGAASALLALLSRRPRRRLLSAAAAAALGASGLAACSDALCLSGYTTDDGSCAWE